MSLKIVKSSILFTRRFSHISECPKCEGLMFNFMDEALQFKALTEEEQGFLYMALIDGESFEDIEADKPFDRKNVKSWECVSCDHKGEAPEY